MVALHAGCSENAADFVAVVPVGPFGGHFGVMVSEGKPLGAAGTGGCAGACARVGVCTGVCACLAVCMHVHTWVCITQLCTRSFMHARVHTCVSVHACTAVHTCVHACVCMHTHSCVHLHQRACMHRSAHVCRLSLIHI